MRVCAVLLHAGTGWLSTGVNQKQQMHVSLHVEACISLRVDVHKTSCGVLLVWCVCMWQ